LKLLLFGFPDAYSASPFSSIHCALVSLVRLSYLRLPVPCGGTDSCYPTGDFVTPPLAIFFKHTALS